MNLNRDDAAGFRLNTVSTCSQHPTLSVDGGPLTTRTDYRPKEACVIQVTTYNFSDTKTTGQICAGVVKAVPVHMKNPTQHFFDLMHLEEEAESKPAMINPVTDERKRTEAIRVDGGADEGPMHLDVQFWWTERHLKNSTEVTIITARESGGSYKNIKAEGQNGCLAMGHANLFIPANLHGSPRCEDGASDQNTVKQNLESAINIYIKRVNGSPCHGNPIHLFKGVTSEEIKTLHVALKQFFSKKRNAECAIKPDILERIKTT